MDLQTQLTSAFGYDTKNMLFSDPIPGSIPNSPISFKRITITTINPNGSIGELIIPTERLFSFGVGENKSMDTGKTNGYVMPLCLHSKDAPTQQEKKWTETFNNIVEKCKDHILENKDSIEQYDLERNDLKKLNPLYYKKDKGKVVDGTGPTLYAKLIVSKKLDKITSIFFNSDGDDVNPLDLLGKYCYTTAAIKIESIFIGNKISLQVKLYEAEVKLAQNGMKRLLRPATTPKRVLNSATSSAAPQLEDSNDDSELESEDSEGSITSDDDESPPPQTAKKVVRKVIKKK